MESHSANIINEIAQTMDQVKSEVKAELLKSGVKVNDKIVDVLFKIYGLDAQRTPEAIATVKNIMKNPKRWLTDIMQGLGVTLQDLTTTVNQQANASQDPQVEQAIGAALSLLQQIELNTSATRSATEMQSSDIYAQIEYLKHIAGSVTGMTQQMSELVSIMTLAAKAAETGKHPLYGIDQTGRHVTVTTEMKDGTVIIDSDNQSLDQAALNLIANTLAQRGIQFTPPTMSGNTLSPEHHAWVLIPETKEVIDVDKSALAPAHFKAVMSTVIHQNPTAAKVIAQIADEAEQKSIAHIFGKLRSATKQSDYAARKMGYQPDKYREIMGVDLGQDLGGRGITMQITSGAYDRPAFKLLSFIGENSDVVQLTDKYVILNGKMENNVFTGNGLEMKFIKLPPKLDYIKSMIFSADERELRNYMATNNIPDRGLRSLGGNKFEIILQ
jgi:hypothetical protein